MKQILIGLLLFVSLLQVANAIPVPALIIGADFLLFLTPILVSFFTLIYFYFKKYIFWINILWLLFVLVMYIWHFTITQELLFFVYEIYFFLCIIITSFMLNKIKYMKYFLLIILIWPSSLLIKTNLSIYNYKKISTCIEETMYDNIVIKNIMFKDNFFVVYWNDIESNVNAYVVVQMWLLDEKYYLQKNGYFIVHGWNQWLWKGLSDIAYSCIK